MHILQCSCEEKISIHIKYLEQCLTQIKKTYINILCFLESQNPSHLARKISLICKESFTNHIIFLRVLSSHTKKCSSLYVVIYKNLQGIYLIERGKSWKLTCQHLIITQYVFFSMSLVDKNNNFILDEF